MLARLLHCGWLDGSKGYPAALLLAIGIASSSSRVAAILLTDSMLCMHFKWCRRWRAVDRGCKKSAAPGAAHLT